ncbi:MAG: Gfo/Idh/MocA family oxidoreductase [Clostridiales bacterium]|nr:Gfo/Idh/MocA family oxidoreductase [Clostridiales bacterium]
MKFGIIGANHGHVFTFVEHMMEENCEFVGIVADGQENTKKLVQEYHVRVFETEEDLFDAGVDIIGCFAPNYLRIDVVEMCAEHKVHVMSDKPLVVNEGDYERLVKASRSGIEIGLMYTVRFEKSVWKLKELLERGEIGDLVNIEMFNPHKLTPDKRPSWHFSKEESGGIAVDLFSHGVDLFRWFTGGQKIVRHYAVMTKSILEEKKDFYDFASANLITENGVSGYQRVDWHIPDAHWNWGDLRIFCLGTKGYAEARVLGDPITREEELIVFSPVNGTKKYELEDVKLNETSDFLKRIAGEKVCITMEDVLASCYETLILDKTAEKQNIIPTGENKV